MRFLTYSEFSLHVHEKVKGQRIPLEGTIELTRRCPMSCLHCYNNLPLGDGGAQSAELSFQEHCRILDEISEAGCLWILYTGGEIFVREDFLDIYTYAKQKGLLITLFTNGTLITPEIAKYLSLWRPFAIEITLYGRTPETHEQLTGIPGSYERCLEGIHLLRSHGLPLKIKTVAVTVNKHEIWDMQRFAEHELGLEFKFDGMINPRIDYSQRPLAVRLLPEEVAAFDLQDARRAVEWRNFATRFNVSPPEIRYKDIYLCGGGIKTFAIDPYGGMSLCVLSHADTYDLRQGSFREGWEGLLWQVRQRKNILQSKCQRCGIKAMCGMCPANGELENRHPESPVDFLCHVAHLRAYALGIPVVHHGPCDYCPGGTRHDQMVHSVALLQEKFGTQLTALAGLSRDINKAGSSAVHAKRTV